jgi:tRNA A37 threonylcarbamoyladenosine modification protein TsaB
LYKNRRNIKLASPAQSLRRPSYLAELGWRRWQAGEVDNPATLSPFYLHTSGLIPGG